MTDDRQQQAAEQARLAAEQAKAAAKNAGRAAKNAAEPVVVDIAEKAEDTAEDALQAARQVNPRVLSRISSDMGVGFLALSVSIYSAAIAYAKFRQALSGRNHVLKPAALTNRYTRPPGVE